MRRPLWLGTGFALGVGGTLWLEQRVRRRLRRAARRVAPDRVAAGARASAAGLGDRVRGAIDAGRQERDRRELELRGSLPGLRPAGGGTEGPEGARRPRR